MYRTTERQFIFKDSTGKVWNLFYDERNGLCYSNLTRRNTWTEPVTLQKNLAPPFFADMDYDDRFHIAFQDKQGNIYYSLVEGASTKTVQILQSKNPSAYNKHFCLIPQKSTTHFFYVLVPGESPILVYQGVDSKGVMSPKVIDYVHMSSCPYCALSDNTGNIYVFYQSSDGKNLQLGYKKFLPYQKVWGEFTPITRYPGDSEFPRAIADSSNIIHICYQRRSARSYELVYQQKVPDKNIWSDETVIHESVYGFANSSIIYADKRLYIYWIREEAVVYSMSEDGGSSWSKPARYNFPGGRQLLCMRYRSNNPYELERLIAEDIPGNFINGYRLAFYQDSSLGSETLSPEELKNMIVNTLKLLKGSVEELKESNAAIAESLRNYAASQKELEKEIAKNSIRLGMLESDLRQLKRISSDPDINEDVNGDNRDTPGDSSAGHDFDALPGSPAASGEYAILPEIQDLVPDSSSINSDEVQQELEEFKQSLLKKKRAQLVNRAMEKRFYKVKPAG